MRTAALRALAEAATPGPWEAMTVVGHEEADARVVTSVPPDERWQAMFTAGEADAALIVACNPETIKLLCDLWEAAARHRAAQIALKGEDAYEDKGGAKIALDEALAALEEA